MYNKNGFFLRTNRRLSVFHIQVKISEYTDKISSKAFTTLLHYYITTLLHSLLPKNIRKKTENIYLGKNNYFSLRK